MVNKITPNQRRFSGSNNNSPEKRPNFLQNGLQGLFGPNMLDKYERFRGLGKDVFELNNPNKDN